MTTTTWAILLICCAVTYAISILAVSERDSLLGLALALVSFLGLICAVIALILTPRGGVPV